MAMRTADKADLSPDEGEHETIRPKTTNTDIALETDTGLTGCANKLDLLNFIPIPLMDPPTLDQDRGRRDSNPVCMLSGPLYLSGQHDLLPY